MTDEYLEFHRLEKKVTFGGCSFFDKEIRTLFDIHIEKSLGLFEIEKGIFKFVTSQPLNNNGDRFYTTWQANVTDLDNTTVEQVGTYRFMNKADAIDLMQRPFPLP